MDSYSVSDLMKEVARRRKREPRQCGQCPIIFQALPHQRWCSRACADKAFYKAHKVERNKARMEARRAAHPRGGKTNA